MLKVIKKISDRITAKNGLEQTLFNAKNQAENSDLKTKLSEKQQQDIDSIFKEYTNWIENNSDSATGDEIRAKEKEANGKFQPIFASVYSQDTGSNTGEQNSGNSKKTTVEDVD